MPFAADIRQMVTGEIEKSLEDAKQELFNLRFQFEIGRLEDPSRIRIVKRNIARYKTVLRERQLAEEVVRREEEDNAE
jgi:large subunit ribosomal protein L29